MRTKLLLISAAVMLLFLVMLPAFSSADTTSTTSNYYIEGYVADTGRMPMEGVTVSVTDSNGISTQSNTDANGFFSVGVASVTGLSISFTVYGYSVITCPNTSIPQGSDSLSLILSKAAYNSQTRTYTITGSVADMQCAIMGASQGTVKGQVTYGTTAINGATVTLSPADNVPDGTNYSANTDSGGNYSISCPTGTYTLTASGQGFDPSNAVTVKVTSSSPSTVNVTLEKSVLKKYAGLDAAHLLMLIGVAVGIILAAAAWFMSRRLNGPHGLEIIVDDEEEDDDFRYP